MRITVSLFSQKPCTFVNLCNPTSPCLSIGFNLSERRKRVKRIWGRKKREAEQRESLISPGLVHPNCHVWVPEYARQAPLSTQSPSLRAGWTASPVPRWMLARSAGLASTCRCRAACFNWQQEKKRLRAVHDMPPPPSPTLPFLYLSQLPVSDLPEPGYGSIWQHISPASLFQLSSYFPSSEKCLSLSLSLSLCVSLKEPSRYLLDETFQWNATSPCLSLKKTNKQTDKKMDLVFKLCRAGGTGCFWQCSAFLVTASMVLNACFF